MMLIRTYVAPSEIYGPGVFAGEPVNKGQEVWLFETELSVVIGPDMWDTLPLQVQDFVNRYGFRHPTDPACAVLEADDGRFMNHSDQPNVDFHSELSGIARRDINKGEELTRNYYAGVLRRSSSSRSPGMSDSPNSRGPGVKRSDRRKVTMSEPEFKAQASDLCQSCGMCCNGVLFNHTIVLSEIEWEFADKFADIITPSDFSNEPDIIVQPCPLFNGCCSQYEIRPQDCKTYQCALLDKLQAGESTVEECRKIIDQMQAALTALATRYNKRTGKSLAREEIFSVIDGLQQEAQAADQEKQFWQSYPEYLTVCFLKERHYLARQSEQAI